MNDLEQDITIAMDINNIHVFTDADLDGTVSYMTLCWFLGKKVPVTVTTEKNLKEVFLNLNKKRNIDTFKRIYFLDIDVSSVIDIIDKKNVTIIDHHLGSLNIKSKIKNCNFLIEDAGSTSKLLYKKLLSLHKDDLTDKRKMLISLAHDYDSYTLKYRDLSIGLNMVFWNLQGNRLEKFSDMYFDGFNGFNDQEKKIISFYENKLKTFIDSTHIFTGTVKIGKEDVKVCSIFADFCINEIASCILQKTNSDIGVVVNLKSQSVSFRKNNKCNINLDSLAKKIANGGGHPNAAGGLITPSFLLFTKFLT